MPSAWIFAKFGRFRLLLAVSCVVVDGVAFVVLFLLFGLDIALVLVLFCARASV